MLLQENILGEHFIAEICSLVCTIQTKMVPVKILQQKREGNFMQLLSPGRCFFTVKLIPLPISFPEKKNCDKEQEM